MSYSRIICLVRGDSTDNEVVDTAVSLASGGNRNIRFVHVIVVDRRFALDAANQTRYADSERILRDAEHASGLRNEVSGSILQARSIAPVLVREALDFGAEAIVLSAKIISTINSKRIDHDSEYLMANAPCAVVLVRDPVTELLTSQDSPDAYSLGVRN